MSEREQAKQIIDQLPEYKMAKILYLLKGIQIDDEIEDELFCESLAEKYLTHIKQFDPKIVLFNSLFQP